MYDLVVRNGHVMDGTGSPWYQADVAIKGEHVCAVERKMRTRGRREIDASELVVAPGFIDMHAHSDATLLVNPRAESVICQGITTQVVGQCGFSAAPVRSEQLEAFRRDSFVFSYTGYEWSWFDIDGYCEALASVQPAINVATLVGHGALRQYAMGQVTGPPNRQELALMKNELDRALGQGAVGLSSGLTYAPGRFAEVGELVELGHVVCQHGGVYHTHMRDYARFLDESIRETIQVSEQASVPANISHLFPAGPAYWGKAAVEATQTVDAARRRGIDVTFDITPWTRGGGPYMQMLPDWAQEGGFASLRERLADSQTRSRIAYQLENGLPDWKGWLPLDWHDQLICRTGAAKNASWIGRSIGELAQERGLPAAEMALLLLLEDEGQYWTAPTVKSQEDINHILRHPVGIPISDGMALAPYGPLYQPTNPRSYGTFPRVLGRYVREWGVLSLEAAVAKMTSMPAQRMGFLDRGLLRPGLCADITVFDPTAVTDRETYQNSHAFPDGIAYVIVNGQLAVEHGRQSDVRCGKVLRSKR